MGAFHTIPSETFYIDHLEEVSGCGPPRLVCVVCRDFRRINHSCDGRAHIQSCCQASQYTVWGNDEAILKGFLLWIHVNHGAEVHHLEETLKSIDLHFPRRGVTDLIHRVHEWCVLHSHAATVPRVSWHHRKWHPTDSFLDVLPWHGWDNGLLASCSKIRRLALSISHQAAPWFHCMWYAYDKVNYERFLSYNYATMSRLPNDHQDVHQQFVLGGFIVQFW